MKRILVLCSANSSRSQMAEGYLSYYAKGYGQFYSAGLEDRGINPLTIKVMAEDNIDVSENSSKSFQHFKGMSFDYLITVCDVAQSRIPKELSAQQYIHFSIPDPDSITVNDTDRLQKFRQIRELIKKHILKFIGRELSDQLEPARV